MKIGIIIFLIYAIVPIILFYLSHSTIFKNSSIYKYSHRLLMFGICSALLTFSAIFLVCTSENFELKFLFVLVIPTLLVIGEFYLIILSMNWKLELKENVFLYRNVWRITKIYQYSDIVTVSAYSRKDCQRTEKYKMVLKNGKKITISYFIINYNSFFDDLKKRIKNTGHRCDYKNIKQRHRGD